MAALAGAVFGAAAGWLAASILLGRARRRQSERLSRLAHDLRTPLASIAAYAEILQDDDDPETRARYLSVIESESARMARMIDEGLERGSTTPPASAGPAGVPSDSAQAGHAILIVEDDRFLAEATRTLLRSEGYDARIATGGESALEKARAERPDLILLDRRMPGMDGDAALRRLRSDPATSGIPVILTTGDAGGPAPEGAAALLVKPIAREALLDAIRSATAAGGRRA